MHKKQHRLDDESGDDGYSNNLGSHLYTEWFFNHGENMPFYMGMWKILLGAASQYSEQ